MLDYLTWFVPYAALLAGCCALVESLRNRRSLQRFRRCDRSKCAAMVERAIVRRTSTPPPLPKPAPVPPPPEPEPEWPPAAVHIIAGLKRIEQRSQLAADELRDMLKDLLKDPGHPAWRNDLFMYWIRRTVRMFKQYVSQPDFRETDGDFTEVTDQELIGGAS